MHKSKKMLQALRFMKNLVLIRKVQAEEITAFAARKNCETILLKLMQASPVQIFDCRHRCCCIGLKMKAMA